MSKLFRIRQIPDFIEDILEDNGHGDSRIDPTPIDFLVPFLEVIAV